MLVNDIGDRSIDGGLTWRLAGADYIVVHTFTDGSLLVADGSWNVIGITTDFVTFTPLNVPPGTGQNYVIQSIRGTNVLHIDNYSGTYYLSLNGGVTWVATQNLMGGLYAQCADGSVIAGFGGALHRTIDGGATFTQVPVPAGYFNKISGAIGNRLISTNSTSTVKYSDDFGATWNNIVLPSAVVTDTPLVTSGSITLIDMGKFVSMDGGATFQATGNGFRDKITPAVGGGFYGVDEGSLAFGYTPDGVVWTNAGVVRGTLFSVPGTTLQSFNGRAIFVIDGYYATDDNNLVRVPSREQVAKSGSSYYGLCRYGLCRSDNGVDWNTLAGVVMSENGVQWLVSDATSIYYSDGTSLYRSAPGTVVFLQIASWSVLASLLTGNGAITSLNVRGMHVSGGDLYLVIGNSDAGRSYFVQISTTGDIVAQSPLDGSSWNSMVVEYAGSVRAYTKDSATDDLFVVQHGQPKEYVMTTYSFRVFGTSLGVVLFTGSNMLASHDFVNFTNLSAFFGLPDFCALNSNGCEMIISQNAIQM